MTTEQTINFDHAAPERTVGEGPYPQLILRDVTLIDGTGCPPLGPVDVVIEQNKIAAIHQTGPWTGPRFQPDTRPQLAPGGREVQLAGHWVLPGLIDAHGHIGWPGQVPNAQYVYDLWLGHGITSVREPGCFHNGLDFVVHEQARSAADLIAAPRIWPYVGFGAGRTEPFQTPSEARAWVNQVAERGAAGSKVFGYTPEIFKATLDELGKLGLGSACHHMQNYVSRVTALDSARWGLTSIEHFYGLPEAMMAKGRIRGLPTDYNEANEVARFTANGQLWSEAAPPGSPPWENLLDQLLDCGTTLDPTFNVYIGLRDVERIQALPWHSAYTAPGLWDYWQPNSGSHGSFFSDWGTEQETLWRGNFRLWMQFVKDYFDRGGRVTVGTDPGSIFSLWGFNMPAEMELLREAGLNPMEIIRAATLSGAQLLGSADQLGSVEVGKLADLLVVDENPLANLKVLYGHGRPRLNPDGSVGRAGGVKYTVKNGVVFNAPELLQRVRATVAAEHAVRTQSATGA
ncbi:MAG: amidohydrolase family protein [Micrococcales bacterium]|nr:amidohydrolase family protein [Micrococcales bacterium]